MLVDQGDGFKVDTLAISVEACRRQCAKDHHSLLEDVVVFAIKENPHYDPNYVDLKDYAPDRDLDPHGWHEAYKQHNFGGDATHTVEFVYVWNADLARADYIKQETKSREREDINPIREDSEQEWYQQYVASRGTIEQEADEAVARHIKYDFGEAHALYGINIYNEHYSLWAD